MDILDLNNMSLKDNLLIISKQQTTCLYHKNFRSYKRLNMATHNKTLCTIRTFSFKKKAFNPICKLLNTIYEHILINKGKWGIKHCSGVKYHFFVCLAICNVCCKLCGFLYIASFPK